MTQREFFRNVAICLALLATGVVLATAGIALLEPR